MSLPTSLTQYQSRLPQYMPEQALLAAGISAATRAAGGELSVKEVASAAALSGLVTLVDAAAQPVLAPLAKEHPALGVGARAVLWAGTHGIANYLLKQNKLAPVYPTGYGIVATGLLWNGTDKKTAMSFVL